MLVDKQIREYVEEGKIELNNVGDFEEQLCPTGIDLRVGPDYLRVGPQEDIIDARNHPNAVLRIEPGTFYKIHTVESISLPETIVGTVEARTTLELSGVGIRTGSKVEPGFEGVLQFGIYNYTDKTVSIRLKYPIVQLSFEKLEEPPENAYSNEDKYQGQESVTTSEGTLE